LLLKPSSIESGFAKSKFLLLPLVAMILVACTGLAPKQTVDLSQTAQHIQSRRLDEPAVLDALSHAGLTTSTVENAWSFEQLSIAAQILRPESALAQANADAAAYETKAATKRQNPVLSLTPEFARNIASGTSPWTIALALSLLIESPAKRAARSDQAKAREQTVLWQQAQSTWKIRSEVHRAVLSLLLAERQQALAQQTLELRADALQVAEARVRVGAWAKPELQRALSAKWQAQSQTAQALQNLEAAKAQLALAVGVTPVELTRHTFTIPSVLDLKSLPTQNWDAMRNDVVINRLDIAEAVSQFDQADATYRELVAKHMPDINVGPGITFDQGLHKLVFGVATEIPLFDRYDAATTASQMRREAAKQQVEVIQAQSLGAFEQARIAYVHSIEAWQKAEAANLAQTKVAQAERRRWKAGEVDKASRVNAELDALIVTQIRDEALSRVINAIHDLEDSVQRPVWPQSSINSVKLNVAPAEMENTK
jgi:outer membrane protein, heavy metal efflux system